ncbi:MAG: proteasome subunit alpha [Acidimicrobiia bacterium]|nr:proteasome subunit alpha [Acidimicrobiia bacterium]
MTVPFYVAPEQLVKDRAEYARKGIARGRSIVAMEVREGVLLLAENPSRTLTKISEIYDRIAFAGVGKYNEFESLRVAGIRYADIKGYQYGRRDVTAKSLASSFSQTLGNIFVQGPKPFEVEVLVAEVGPTINEDRLFKVTYDGTLYDKRGYTAIGGQADELSEQLGERYQETPALDEALDMAAQAFRQVEERAISGWEAALLEREGPPRRFRRLSSDHLESIADGEEPSENGAGK